MRLPRPRPRRRRSSTSRSWSRSTTPSPSRRCRNAGAAGAIPPLPSRGTEAGLRVLFIHGAGAQDTDDSSQPLLRGLRRALGRKATIEAPIMPDPDNPDAGAWGRAVRKHLKAMDEDFVAVGHSLGASTILKELAERGVPRKLRGVVTLAMPYWPDWKIGDYAVPKDVGRLKKVPLVLYFSSADETVAMGHADRYAKLLPHAVVKRITGTDHLYDKAPFKDVAADIAALAGGGG